MVRAVVEMVVHAHHHGEILALGRGGNNHLLRAGFDMALAFAVGKRPVDSITTSTPVLSTVIPPGTEPSPPRSPRRSPRWFRRPYG